MYEIETVINNIFTNEETKKTYLSILWTCLSGIRQERFLWRRAVVEMVKV